MRRLLVITAALLLVAAVGFVSYRAFSGHDTDLKYDELSITEKNLSEGIFTVKAKCTKKGYFVCGCRGEIKDGTLYLTFEANIDEARALETDADGFFTVKYDCGGETVKNAYYRCSGKTNRLTFGK